jgi:prepilin-type processing-associated H-X9-DG protein
VLSQAHARAKNAACKNNLRQVGLALEQYTQTYNAYAPQTIWRPTTMVGWWQLLGVYFGRPLVPFDKMVGPTPPGEPFVCPVYSAGMRNLPFDPFTPYYSYNTWGTITYSGIINGVISRPLGVGAESFQTDDNGNLMNPDVWITVTVRESDVVAPSEMVALSDPFSRSEAPQYDGYCAFPGGCVPIPKDWSNRHSYPTNPQANQNAVRKHGGRFNRFYCDGHIGSESFTKPFVVTDDYLAQWNIDHQPHRDSWLRW